MAFQPRFCTLQAVPVLIVPHDSFDQASPVRHEPGINAVIALCQHNAVAVQLVFICLLRICSLWRHQDFRRHFRGRFIQVTVHHAISCQMPSDIEAFRKLRNPQLISQDNPAFRAACFFQDSVSRKSVKPINAILIRYCSDQPVFIRHRYRSVLKAVIGNFTRISSRILIWVLTRVSSRILVWVFTRVSSWIPVWVFTCVSSWIPVCFRLPAFCFPAFRLWLRFLFRLGAHKGNPLIRFFPFALIQIVLIQEYFYACLPLLRLLTDSIGFAFLIIILCPGGSCNGSCLVWGEPGIHAADILRVRQVVIPAASLTVIVAVA